MRLFIFTLLLLLSSGLNASGNSTLASGNGGDSAISITQEDGTCGSQICIEVTKTSKSKKTTYTKKFPFYDECYFTLKGKKAKRIDGVEYNGHDGMVCYSKGRTPLAGATYKVIQFGRSDNSCAESNELGNKYICIKGCGNTIVPEYLAGDDGIC